MSQTAFNRAIEIKEKQHGRLLLVLSLTANLVMGVCVSILINRTIIVYEDNGKLAVLKQKEFELDEPRLKEFVKMVARECLSFNPKSLPGQLEDISAYLTQEPAKNIMESYERNKKKIQDETVFYDFIIKNVLLIKSSEPFKVEIDGIRTVFVNNKEIDKEAKYLFEVKRVRPAENNPYGLIVSSITEKEEDHPKQ